MPLPPQHILMLLLTPHRGYIGIKGAMGKGQNNSASPAAGGGTKYKAEIQVTLAEDTDDGGCHNSPCTALRTQQSQTSEGQLSSLTLVEATTVVNTPKETKKEHWVLSLTSPQGESSYHHPIQKDENASIATSFTMRDHSCVHDPVEQCKM